MIETTHFYKSFFSEIEILLAEVEQWLHSVVIEYQEYDALEVITNGIKLN